MTVEEAGGRLGVAMVAKVAVPIDKQDRPNPEPINELIGWPGRSP